jgi:hypothetical protein
MESNEDRKDPIEELKDLVDSTANEIESGGLAIDTANRLVEETRKKAEKLIPDDMDKYDMIYGARFARLIEQYVVAMQKDE